jgi:tetratricopeptide (TPR) repeat protein
LHRYPPLAGTADSPPDAGGLVASLAYDVPGNTARLEALVGWATEGDNHAGKVLNLEAAFACDLITRIVPHELEYSRHWNNLGLFLRDEGDRLRGTQGALEAAPKPYDEALVNKLWTESLAAYEAALEIDPKNPNYLNDTAVMLHYYFVRDLERAKEMYRRGNEEAKILLKRTDLSKETRDAVEIALRDTGNNLRLVQKLIDKRAAEAGAPKGDKPAKQ